MFAARAWILGLSLQAEHPVPSLGGMGRAGRWARESICHVRVEHQGEPVATSQVTQPMAKVSKLPYTCLPPYKMT